MTRLFEAKPFIIAEVGSNFHDLRDCLDSISAAKACGADAVKFQMFHSKALYGYLPFPRYDDETFNDTNLPKQWLPAVKEKADACGIEFMCTAFSEELVDIVDPFVSVHKVASSDNTHVELIRHIKRKGKPILLSCGASSLSDIKVLLGSIEFKKDELVLLYCNASYPSFEHNLFEIEGLKFAFKCHVGLSDHSLDVVWAPLSAVDLLGAIVIEKHFRLDRITGTPDAPHSLDQRQFKLMTNSLRRTGDGHGYGTSEENDFRLRHKRRAVAIKDIQPGELLQYGVNYGYYRVLEPDNTGFSALYGKLVGIGVNRFIRAGEPIGLKDRSDGNYGTS